jgi:hypothetical protein
MDRPIIERDEHGNIHKFWTMEAAEAAEREAKERLAERIAASRRKPQRTLFGRAADLIRRVAAIWWPRSARAPHPERI